MSLLPILLFSFEPKHDFLIGSIQIKSLNLVFIALKAVFCPETGNAVLQVFLVS